MQEKLTLDENIVKHIVLSKYRDITKQLGGEFGDHILLCDGRSWRKDVYKYYKANRGDKTEDEGPIDWALVFRMMDECKAIFEEHFPFYVIRHPRMEADDLIAAFALQADEPVVIVSKDKDFFQLHSDTVHQWDYSKKKFIDHPDPARQRLELIIRGDSGDGVPSILSDDDTFVNDAKRQPQMREKRFAQCLEWAKNDFEDAPEKYVLCKEHKKAGVIIPEKTCDITRNWHRNKELIDLMTPKQEAMDMINRYYEQKPKNVSKMDTANFLTKNKMVMLLGKVSDFFENGNSSPVVKRKPKPKVTSTGTGSLSKFL